jgi:exosome complex RNA-binding protein Rrp42 (RNase PH superfamily)
VRVRGSSGNLISDDGLLSATYLAVTSFSLGLLHLSFTSGNAVELKTMNQKIEVSKSELKFIIEGCRDNCRLDGRAGHEYRSYTTLAAGNSVETNLTKSPPLVSSQGSARVFLATGETHVLVSVKAELVRPAADNPERGVVSVHVDAGNKRNEELESTLASLLLPHLLDTNSLCIVPGLYAWKLNIDVLVLDSAGGSLLDACSLGINKALLSTLLPNVTFCPAQNGEKGSLQLDSDLSKGVFLSKEVVPPSIITATMLKSPTPVFILDATKAEEACAYAQIHIVVDVSDDSPKICALQTSGKEPLSLAVFQDATSFVLKSISSDCSPFKGTHRLPSFSESGAKNSVVPSLEASPDLLMRPTFVLQQSLHGHETA